MPAIELRRHVDVDDIALAQHFGAGNAVADNVVDRRTDRFWEPSVVKRGRDGAARHDEIMAQGVDLFRCHAGHDEIRDIVEGLGRQAPGAAHPFEIGGFVQFDRAGVASGGFGGFGVHHEPGLQMRPVAAVDPARE